VPEPIVYSPQPRWMRTLAPLVVIACVALPVASWIATCELRPRNFVLPVTCVVLIALGRLFVRSRVVADAHGVDLAGRNARVDWDQVDHVRRPGQWDFAVRSQVSGTMRGQ
jgi:hypothetical protein